MVFILIILLFSAGESAATGDSLPLIKCVSTNHSTGQLFVNWQQPSGYDTSFINYEIQLTNDTSLGYTPLSTSQYAYTDTIDSTLFACGNDLFFRIRVIFKDTAGNNASSDWCSARNINLQLDNSSSRLIKLNWNFIRPVKDTLDSQFHYIYRDYKGSGLILFDSVQFGQFNYIDSFPECPKDSAYYQIRFDYNDCTSQSCLIGDTFFKNPPPIPEIDFISIDTATGHPFIKWSNTGNDQDIGGYNVILAPKEGTTPINQTLINGIKNISYLDTAIEGNLDFFNYQIQAFDTCSSSDGRSAGSFIFSSIYLEVDADLCQRRVLLSWNEALINRIVGLSNVNEIILFRSDNESDFKIEQTLAVGTIAATVNNLTVDVDYRFFIAFVNDSGQIAYSNIVNTSLTKSADPSVFKIQRVNATADSGIQVEFVFDPTVVVGGFYLQRAYSPDGQFIDVAYTSKGGSLIYNVFDTKADFMRYQYFFRIQVEDTCGKRGIISKIQSNLFLQSDFESDAIHSLFWNQLDLIGADSPEEKITYKLFRSINDTFSNTAINSFDFQTLEFVDDFSSTGIIGGQICYYIQASQPTIDSFGGVFSNQLCFEKEARIFAATAFTPDGDGLNDSFRPQGNFFNQLEYLFRVHDRKGRIIFETTNPLIGWDADGVPVGVYPWQLTTVNQLGDEIVQKGLVTVYR